MLFSSRVRVRIRVRIRFSVWSISCYVHVFVLLSIVIVTLSISYGSTRRVKDVSGQFEPDIKHTVWSNFVRSSTEFSYSDHLRA